VCASDASGDTDDQLFPVGGDRLEKWLRACLHIPMDHYRSVLAYDADVRGAGMPVDATVQLCCAV
jgi:hypothetical protein